MKLERSQVFKDRAQTTLAGLQGGFPKGGRLLGRGGLPRGEEDILGEDFLEEEF